MFKHKSRLVAAIVALSLIAISSPTNAFFGFGGKIVFDPANFQQNVLTAAHMAQSLTNEATQIANQIKQYNDMIKHGQQITNGQWGDIKNLLTQLSGVTAQGDALAYSMNDLDSQFNAAFPGYKAPTNWRSEYEAWTKNGLDTLKGVLKGVGIQHQQMASEQDRLRAIQSLSDGAVGRMQALQAGNMIASEQAQQMAKLRQLVMMQTNAQSVYYAHRINTDAAQEAKVQQWLQAPRPEVPEYGSAGFGKMPKIGQ